MDADASHVIGGGLRHSASFPKVTQPLRDLFPTALEGIRPSIARAEQSTIGPGADGSPRIGHAEARHRTLYRYIGLS